ncbi:MAG: STAS domain-containing protein [Candidatus Omnitrophota bacterium]|jgi:anti-anti-sigma factor|nr:MAG: STAS domain-containing protein [Candidatus Omnitrophota bacterium]
MIEIKSRKADSVAILDLDGALDLDGSQLLKESIQQERKKGSMKILLNFTGVTSVMSAHLQNLLTPIRALTMIKGTVGLCGMTPSVQKTMRTAMFYKIVKVYETEAEALSELKLLERNL